MKVSILKTFLFIFFLLIPSFIFVNNFMFKSKDNHPTNFAAEDLQVIEKPFVFLLYSSDVLKTCEQNISSILEQKYENYRIVLMETSNIRCSTNMIKTMIGKENKTHLLSIHSYIDETPTIECFQKTLETFGNDEIVVQLDCNNWLANTHVLEKLNQIYSSSLDTWLTYSQYLEYPSYQKGSIDPYMKKTLRNRNSCKTPWLSSPFKTYYAKLRDKITLYLENSPELAPPLKSIDLYFLSLAKYGNHHIRFIDDVLYVRNIDNPTRIH